MIVTFSGVDGSGKTTHALWLKTILQEKGLNVKYIHMIKWSLVNRIGRLIYGMKGVKRGGVSDINEKRWYKPVILLVIWIDVLLFYIYYIWMVHFRGAILICDRYFFDLGVHYLYNGVMGNLWEKAYWQMVLSPSYAILLDVNPQTARDRESEHDLSYYKRKRAMYRDRSDSWGCKIISEDRIEDIQQQILIYLSPLLENFVPS